MPECCEIEHIGVNKKKEFPCGGYYLICGRYLKYPEEELISVEELAENDFKDDREDPRISIGRFEFDFQCEDYIIKNIPEDIPEGFICVRFWCENMRWLLDEKTNADMIMYEPPRFWEIGKMLKEKSKAKQQKTLYLKEQKQLDKMRKIIVFKYKAKKNIRNKKGHRQPFTAVKITDIVKGE